MADFPRNIELSERAQHLFKCLVERYIADGQPVGSRTLARDAKLELSPATIRNVMADLEDCGLISSPHTSAGRIPTVRGYRLFVDCMLTYKRPQPGEIMRLNDSLQSEADVRRLFEKTSSLLSDVTRLAGLVMLPKTEQHMLRQVEFLALSDNRVLVILVINDREVQNRIIRTPRRYSPSELTQAANYLNAAFAGKDIRSVKRQLLADMAATREEMDRMMQAVIDVAKQAFVDDEPGQDYVLAGQTNLMEISELSDIDNLRSLFEAFNHKRDVLHLLDQALSASGVQIFIGEESGYEAFGNCSIVTSTYGDDGEVLGVVGVIGPTRMEYERVIPIVDLTAKMLSSALNSMQ
ncbi:MAG: heat-inducible transcriptional repressor HrcA [Gammaproteobacteria bacterium]|nr:heat-inducible transcriptional repressor HrcA [Gammaproteobacteria bacterium]MBI5614871.1 heat-inducible transcriptional repressor HrcA [Gammaproteobacteria bacterium]